MAVVTLGLTKIEVGDIASDGGMGTTLAPLGLTFQDTCKFAQDDPEETEFFAEEVDDPIVIISRPGKVKFNFSIMDPVLATLKKLFGGTITGIGDDEKWEAPDKFPNIEQSVKITPEMGLKFEIPRMKITAKINGEFSKKGLFLIEVAGTVLQPEKASVAKIMASKVITG